MLSILERDAYVRVDYEGGPVTVTETIFEVVRGIVFTVDLNSNSILNFFEVNDVVLRQVQNRSVAHCRGVNPNGQPQISERPANALSVHTTSSASSLFLLSFISLSFSYLRALRCRHQRPRSFISRSEVNRTSIKLTMWLSTKLSALWLAACALAGPPDTVITGPDGIRSIPVRQDLDILREIGLIERL